MFCRTVGVALFGGSLLSLHGCGGGGGGDSPVNPDPHDAKPTPSPSPGVPTPVPPPVPPVDPCISAPSTPKGTGPDAFLVDELNQIYMGFDESDPNSPVGVTMRTIAPDMDASFWCGTPCYSGYADCRVSASMYNNKVLIKQDSFEVAVTMSRLAGIIYNQTSVEQTIGKCFYMYDATTWGRTNHGCGCATPGGCDTPDGAYQNQECQYEHPEARSGVKKGTCHDNTEKSPDVDQCWCNSDDRRKATTPLPEHAKTTSQQCFFRGPALYPPAGTFTNEYHEAMRARIKNQANPPIENKENSTEIIIKQEFWNEIIIEAQELERMLKIHPSYAYSAFFYIRGFEDGKKKAMEIQEQVFQQWGGPRVPIVEFDPKVDTRCTAPFRTKGRMPVTVPPTTTTTWDGLSCAGEWGTCGGGPSYSGPTCCSEGLYCAKKNAFFAQCEQETTSTTTAATTTTTTGVIV